jgi:adenylate kinase
MKKMPAGTEISRLANERFEKTRGIRRTACVAQLIVFICGTGVALPLRAGGPIVLIIGPPGSGRTTQAQLLKANPGMPVISADDLIARDPISFQKYKIPALHGVDPHLDPALDRLVQEALKTADLSRGVVLDGYPASKEQGDFLAGLGQKLGLARSIIIHLAVPDEVVRSRLKSRNRPDLEDQIKDYHREFDFLRLYFTEADIHTVDGTMKPEAVAKQIRKILEDRQK